MPKRESTPCFAIYVLNQSKPFIFFASSERKVKDWLNQISIFCTKYSGLTSLSNAITLVSTDGFGYYSYVDPKNARPIFFTQIGIFLFIS